MTTFANNKVVIEVNIKPDHYADFYTSIVELLQNQDCADGDHNHQTRMLYYGELIKGMLPAMQPCA